MKKIIVALALAMALIMSGCSLTADSASDPAFRTLRYEGGDVGGSKFKECVADGEKLASNDAFYSYPRTQRQDKWDSANFEKGAKSADYPDMVLTDKSGIGINLKVTVPFTLNTSCEEVKVDGKTYPGGVIQVFHEVFGKTRNGYFDPTQDGNTSYGEGWLWLMDTYISNCVVQQLTPKVRAEDAEQLWLDDGKRKALTDGLTSSVQDCVNNSMETDLQFYTIGNATVDSVTPDAEFLALFRERIEAEKRAETAQVNQEAQVKQAEADAAVAKAQAEIKKAEISAYGNVDNYLKKLAIDKNINPYQPTGTIITQQGQ